ncbi:MAG: Gfo/Idh/MocA family oxidoreductase [Bacteroidota bacterium]
MKKQNKHSALNRRDFMKNSSLAMGGMMLSSLPVSASAYVAGDDAIKVGLVGCGGRGTGAVVQALSSGQNVKLVAMCDAFRDKVDECYQKITRKDFKDWSGVESDVSGKIDVPEANRLDGFDAYKKVIDACDVVILATPPGFRPSHFEYAIQQGKHVFMEKPVATDAVGVRKVLAAAKLAKQKKLNVVVGLQRHYQKIYQVWVDMMHGGAIGDITSGSVFWNSDGVWVRERQPGQTEMEYQMRNWYYFNWLCGDHINEQHIHNIDVANWVLQGYPVKAQGMGGRQVRNGKDHGEIFDHHFVEFEYANGAKIYSQCRHIKGCMRKVSESFTGTNGTAPAPGKLMTTSGYKLLNHNDKKDPNPYQVEHDLLFAAIANGEYKYADAENGAKSTMSAILGRMATYSGQMVEWDAAINSNIDLMPKTLAWDATPPILPDENGYYPIPVPGKSKVI